MFIYLLEWMYLVIASSLWEQLEESQKMRLTHILILQLKLFISDPITTSIYYILTSSPTYPGSQYKSHLYS